MSKLLFATLGSLGDVRPLLAIAMAGVQRGNEVTFATSESFRSLVENAGIAYEVFGSDDYFEDCGTRAGLVEPRTGFGLFMALSNLRAMGSLFSRLDHLAQDIDGIVSTPLVMAAHLVAQRRQLPLVSCALSPAMLLANGRGASDPYAGEWRSCLNGLRTSVGLPRRSFPQMERFSANLTLGIYPRCLTGAEEPMIREPCELGYPFLDDADAHGNANCELLEWMGFQRCVVISFGSYVDEQTVRIFDSARKACAALGFRLLLISKYRFSELAGHRSTDVRIEQYVSHQAVMRNAAVVVHHCGVGTLAAAAAAQRPMIVIPFGLDQTYNAQVLGRRNLADILPAHDIIYEDFRDALSRALDQWAQRAPLWLSWLDEGGGSSAHRAMAQVEAVVHRHAKDEPFRDAR